MIFFTLGLMASAFGTVVGFGGGIFVIPILVLLFSVPLPLAVGAVVVSLIPSALVSSLFNARAKTIDYPAALVLEIPTLMGALLGAYLTDRVPVRTLEVIFSIFLLGLAGRLLRQSHQPSGGKGLLSRLNQWGPGLKRAFLGRKYRIGYLLAFLGGSFSGLIAGLFGVGGGFLKTPLMIHGFAMDPVRAVGTALFMIVITTSTAGFSHWQMGHVEGALAAPLVLGFFVGALAGQPLKARISAKHLSRLIAWALGLAALCLLAHSQV